MNSTAAHYARPLVWAFRLLIGVIIAMAILTVFYATDHKPFALSLLRRVVPLTLVLPSLTQNMRLTRFNARLYDFFVVLSAAIQGLVLGVIVDLIRWLRRKATSRLRHGHTQHE